MIDNVENVNNLSGELLNPTSGNEEILGPNKTDFHLLLNWKW